MSVGAATAHVAPPLRVIGQGRLKKLAAALEQAAADGVSGAAAEAALDERLVVLIDPPAFAAAWALQHGAAKGVQAALNQWLEFVQESMGRWSRAPTEVLLLDGSSSDRAALAAAVGRWCGRRLELPSTDEVDRDLDPILLQLAHRACAATLQIGGVLWTLADAGLVFADTADADPPSRPTTAAPSPGRFRLESREKPVSEVERLRRCVSEAQRELEDVYRQLFEASAEIKARSVTGGRTVRAGHVRLSSPAQAQLSEPLRFEIRELQIAGRAMVPRAHVELHLVNGEPELRLYGTGADPEVLYAWRSDASSEGRHYMRFLPSAAEDRLRLQMLGEADWQTVVAIASLLQREVDQRAEEASQTHRVAVARFRRQIGAIPARFRYDALRVSSAGPGDLLDVCFEGAAFGSLPLGQVRLRWSAAALDWQLNAGDTELPLTLWPVDTAGVPAPAWSLPVGGGRAAKRAHAQIWQAMSHEDRALLLAVLDALPASAAVAGDELARRRGGREAMAASAAALLRQAHGSLAAAQIKARLRRVRGLGWLMR